MEAVQFSRLVIEEGDQTFALALHPRLTVVAGLDDAARKGLVAELIGGLGSTRRGVNLELADDRGRRLAVLRPAQGGHKVVDLRAGTDVSDEFRGPDGRLDLLARYGLDARRAHELLHLDRPGLERSTKRDENVIRLSELDQTALWSAAARVRVTDDELKSVVVETNNTAEDAETIDRIERRHQNAEDASEKLRRYQREAAVVCGVALVGAIGAVAISPSKGLPLLIIAALAAGTAALFRAHLAKAQRSERSALAAAGADSYLGFVVSRVNDMMEDTEVRRRRIAVAEDHRNAAISWTRLAGDVSVEWALAHHEQIDTAARLRRELASLGKLSTTAPTLDDETASLAQALIGHLGRLRTIGTGGESLPLVLDDPFTEVPPSTKLTLVELLSRAAGSPQVILVTDQPEVASWARLEALTGDVALVEPHFEASADRVAAARDLAV